jgi:hypothetical protein
MQTELSRQLLCYGDVINFYVGTELTRVVPETHRTITKGVGGMGKR